jgi:hypothetical protein
VDDFAIARRNALTNTPFALEYNNLAAGKGHGTRYRETDNSRTHNNAVNMLH